MSYTNEDFIEVRSISDDHQTIHAKATVPKDTLLGFFDGKAMLIDLDKQSELDDYWTLDANLEWEPLDKRFAVEFAAYNLLDKPFEVAPSVPGWGRTYMGSLKVRF